MGDEWVTVDCDANTSIAMHVEAPPPLTQIKFDLNGSSVTVDHPDPEMKLSEYLRLVAGLSGTKQSCREGGCGACTVVVDRKNGQPAMEVNSCLRLLCSMDGQAVTTIEGIGSGKTTYHPIQTALAHGNGSQCGFCSPGMVMSMYGLLQRDSKPSAAKIEAQFDGNLCRCTGYRPILDAMHTVASVAAELVESPCVNRPPTVLRPISHSATPCQWYSPTSLDALCAIVASADKSVTRLVAANTGYAGVAKYYNGEAFGTAQPSWTTLIDMQHVPELFAAPSFSNGALSCGAGASIASLIDALEAHSSDSSTYGPIATHALRIANNQVRNVGSVGGNLMLWLEHPWFASDMALLMQAAGATLRIVDCSTGQHSTSSMSEWHSAGATAMVGKLLLNVCVPAAPSTTQLHTYKVMLRRQNAHAVVNAAFKFDLDASNVLKECSILYGGIVRGLCSATSTAQAMVGKAITAQDTLTAAITAVTAEVVPDPTPGKVQYRASLVPCLLYKAFLASQPCLPNSLTAAAQMRLPRELSTGSWRFDGVSDEKEYPVSEPIPKLSAQAQCSGEARYTDDAACAANELHAVFVVSTQGRATIGSVDTSAALAAPGVLHWIDEAGMKAAGCRNSFYQDTLLATDKAEYAGQPIGIIVADTRSHAEQGARLVTVEYKDIQKPILSIEDAIEAESYFVTPRINPFRPDTWTLGDSSSAMKSADVVVEGSFSVGHQ